MRDERGVALMMVIWVMMVLTVIAASFAFESRTAALSARAFTDDVKDSFIAEAGVQYAIMKILARQIALPSPEDWRADGTQYIKETPGGYTAVRIMNEGGKVDINQSSPVILGGLLDALGVPPEERDVIVDSIQDWSDKDDLVRVHGAEDEYYMSLQAPYGPKNDRFASVEELLMVRGVTPELLYGGGGRKGLVDFITVYSPNGKIYVNSAPREVLMALPGMTEESADAVLRLREGDNLLQIGDIQGVAAEAFFLMGPFISSYEGSIYSIESVGFSDSGGGGGGLDSPGESGVSGAPVGPGYGIKAVVAMIGATDYKFLYWKDRAVTGGLRTPGELVDDAEGLY